MKGAGLFSPLCWESLVVLSVLLLFRRVREEQPCGHQYLVSPGLDDVMLQEREGQVRRAECLISTHMCLMSGRHL